MNENKKYLNQKEVAEILGVKITTINRWRTIKRFREMPHLKIGNRIILYPKKEFFAWLKKQGSSQNIEVNYE